MAFCGDFLGDDKGSGELLLVLEKHFVQSLQHVPGLHDRAGRAELCSGDVLS